MIFHSTQLLIANLPVALTAVDLVVTSYRTQTPLHPIHYPITVLQLNVALLGLSHGFESVTFFHIRAK